jgi:hypothetical protein
MNPQNEDSKDNNANAADGEGKEES